MRRRSPSPLLVLERFHGTRTLTGAPPSPLLLRLRWEAGYSNPATALALLFTLLLATLLPASSGAQQAHSAAFESARRKFEWIAQNGESAAPSPSPTVLTAGEWNAYLNEGGVKLPEGISNGRAEIDFDRLTANRTRGNPLLYLFTGKHQVTVNARTEAADGIATLHVNFVAFDGVEIPRLALEYFATRYLRPRYGNAVGLDSTFPLHNRIDTAIVSTDQVTITQR